MKCSKCGNEISSGQRFCAHCGAEQLQQDVSQGQSEVSLSPSFENTSNDTDPTSNGSKVFLTVFSVICGVVYGLGAVGGLIGLLLNLLGGYFSVDIILSALYIITGVWMCFFLVLIAFRWRKELSDGLLLCVCGGGVARVLIRLFNIVVLKIIYPDIDGAVIIMDIIGVVITVGGVYLILRFLLGENPIFGKTVQELQEDLKFTFSNLEETIRRGGEKKAKVIYYQDQTMQGQGIQYQDQAMQGQSIQYQDQAMQGQGIQYQNQAAQNNPPIGNGGQVPNVQFGSYGQIPPGASAMFQLKTDRSLLLYIVLNIVTCGIYSLFFIYTLARDINVACDGDGRTTGGLLKYILLTIITCGIYHWIWYYGVGNRLAANAPRYGMNFQENGTTILLWQLFGTFLCGIGPLMALHIVITNTNMLCGAYNRLHNI